MDKEYSCLVRDYALPSTPPPKSPSPTLLSADWFRRSFSKSIMPPALQLRFPFNLVSASIFFLFFFCLKKKGLVYFIACSRPTVHLFSYLSIISCFKVLSCSHKAARKRGALCRSTKSCRYPRRTRTRGRRSCR